MSSLSDKSTFLIQSSDNQSFGTGFVVKKDSDGSYLVTCIHVVEECKEAFLEVAGKKAELLYQGSSDSIDLAVIYVKGLTNTEALNLCINTINKNLLFEINGFKVHKRESFKFETLTGSIKKVSKIHTPNRTIKTYELSIGEDDRIEKGYSGSAVILAKSNTVIAIATDRNKNGKDAYAIPIAYLKEIWEEMPRLVACEDEMNYRDIEKVSFWKKMENQALNTIGGVIVMAVITGFIYDAVKPKESNPLGQNITLGSGNSNVTITQNIGLTDKSLELIIQPYQEKITKLKEQLKNSSNDEEKIKYITLLEKANEEKAKKDKEIAKLKELIENAKYKIVKEATVIFEKEGIEKALAFLQNSSNSDKEKLLKENMKEMAEKYRLEAQFLVIENRYDEAKKAYKQALKYDNNVDTLFDYAYFLQSQNYFAEAITNYEKFLIEQRVLAKTNPTVYNDKVATTLNNLAVLYYANNQMQKAEEAYGEALTLYRALAKTNPKVYNDKVATTLNNLAVLYSANNQMQKAEEEYGEALALYRALAKTNPKVYNADVAGTLNNFAILYYANNQMQKAEEAYGEALILYRALAKTSPKVYNDKVAITLNNLALLSYANNQIQKAEEEYGEALALYRALAKINPKVYNDKVAGTLNNFAILYYANNQMQKAEESYGEALILYRALAKTSPKVYNDKVAMTLNHLGLLSNINNQMQKSEKSYIEALTLYKALAKINPKLYNDKVATTLNNLAILYSINNQMQKSEEAYSEALRLRRALVKRNPKVYGIVLANSLIMGVDLLNQPSTNLNEAEAILQKFRGIPKAEWLLGIIEKLRKKENQ